MHLSEASIKYLPNPIRRNKTIDISPFDKMINHCSVGAASVEFLHISMSESSGAGCNTDSDEMLPQTTFPAEA